MNILVLGAAGEVGAEAARIIALNRNVSKVTLGDPDRRGAEFVRESISGKAVFEQIDPLDSETISALMERHHAVLNCLEPFGLHEERMLRAAMKARTGYASICDDCDAIEAALAMDREIRKAGITAICGTGCTPGLSNVMAAEGIRLLDETDYISIAWAGGLADMQSPTAIRHILRAFNGEASTRENGKWRKVQAGSGEETVEFPEPIGRQPVSHLPHPEPLTIPHYFKSIDTVTMKGGVWPSWFNSVARTLAKARATDTVFKRDRLASMFNVFARAFRGEPGSVSGLRVLAIGTRGGKPARVELSVTGPMRRLAAVPAATAALKIAAGEIDKKGFNAPEAAFDSEKFLLEISEKDVKVLVKQVS